MDKVNAEAMFFKGVDRLGYKLMGGIARIFGALAGVGEEAYWQTIRSASGNGFADLTAVVGNQIEATMEIGQEADFVGTRLLVRTVTPSTGALLDTASFSLLIKDGGSDRLLMKDPTHIDVLAGNAKQSVPFTKNRLFKRNSVITFTITNLVATATRVYLALQGYKIFPKAGQASGILT